MVPALSLARLPQKPVTGTDSMKDFVLVNGGIEPVLKMKVGATLAALHGARLAMLADMTCARPTLPIRDTGRNVPQPTGTSTPTHLQAGVYQRWRVIQTGYKRYLDMQVSGHAHARLKCCRGLGREPACWSPMAACTDAVHTMGCIALDRELKHRVVTTLHPPAHPCPCPCPRLSTPTRATWPRAASCCCLPTTTCICSRCRAPRATSCESRVAGGEVRAYGSEPQCTPCWHACSNSLPHLLLHPPPPTN